MCENVLRNNNKLQTIKQITCKAIVLQIARKNLNGNFALYDRWAQSLWAPAVIPNPATGISAKSKNKMMSFSPRAIYSSDR